MKISYNIFINNQNGSAIFYGDFDYAAATRALEQYDHCKKFDTNYIIQCKWESLFIANIASFNLIIITIINIMPDRCVLCHDSMFFFGFFFFLI